MLVAVYGSLRKGLGNHGVMKRARGEYQFTGITKDNINMYSLGAFPCVDIYNGSHGVPCVVEVYEVDEEGVEGPLDSLEGYPNFYDREMVPVVDESGEEHMAWIYFIKGREALPVESGDWSEFYG